MSEDSKTGARQAGDDYLARLMAAEGISERCAAGLAVHEAGRGRALVLLHGGSGSWNHWARTIGPLARHFRVLAIDQPGFGGSATPPDSIDYDGYIALISAAVDELLTPGEGLDLACFSFGGTIGMGLAVALGGRLGRLSLLAPGGFGKPTGRDLGVRRLRRDMSVAERDAVYRHNLRAMMFAHDETLDEATLGLHLRNLERTRFRSTNLSHLDVAGAMLARLNCPVQMLWGALDPMPWPSLDDRLAVCRQARPDLEFATIADAGHWAQYERAQSYNRLLLDFLRAAR